MTEDVPITEAIKEERDAPPLHEVTQTLPDIGKADLELHGFGDADVDLAVVPIRAPEAPEDVELVVDIGRHQVRLTMSEDDVLALEDAIHTALQAEDLD